MDGRKERTLGPAVGPVPLKKLAPPLARRWLGEGLYVKVCLMLCVCMYCDGCMFECSGKVTLCVVNAVAYR